MHIYCKCELAYRLLIQNTQEQKHEGQSSNYDRTVPNFLSCGTMSCTSCMCPRRQPFIFQVILHNFTIIIIIMNCRRALGKTHLVQPFQVMICCVEQHDYMRFSGILHLVIFFFLTGSVLCSVAMEAQGYLTLVCGLKLAPRIYKFRSSFCPLLSLEKGEFIGMFLLEHFFFYFWFSSPFVLTSEVTILF